jgi:hypothetical protein
MKKLSAVLCLALLIAFPDFAQYTWQLKMTGGGRGNPILIDPVDKNIIYYGSSSSIFRSIDKGETFSQYGTNIPQSSAIKCLHLNPSRPNEIVVAVYKGSSYKMVKSTDSGANWVTTADNLSFSFYGIPSDQDPSHPDTLYLMNGNNFDRSTDFGSTWTTITSNVGTSQAPCDLIVFPDTSIILVGDLGHGIFKSTDYGMTWGQKYSTSGEIPTIAVDFRNPGTAWATKFSGGGGIIRSTNYGETWTTVAYSGISTWGVHIHPENSDFVIVGTWSGSNIYITRNWGSTWHQTTLPASNYSVAIIDTMNVFAAQSGGFYKLFSPSFVPVELSSFTANVINNKVHLEWSTSTETNNLGFDIEHSYDNNQFVRLDFVSGSGTTTENKSYSYTVDKMFNSKSYFRLKQIDYDGTFKIYDAVEVDALLPNLYDMTQNFPNPFNPSTTISFSLPVDANIKITVFNSLGEKIHEITEASFSSGIHNVSFNADEFSSGIYYYKMQANGIDGTTFSSVKKMIVMK